ncbi:HNH endonuclease signature motif containing protein [Streptomyces sp. NPDC091368]|uniref:HNH endonuclease signature motif containing protein n=1 Tax=Streptomyces sp. NPDC091368 TaxID=3365993 RepID=UPI003801B81E
MTGRSKPAVAAAKPVRLTDGSTIQLDQGVLDRLWGRISVDSDGCWLWTGRRLPTGYGRIQIARSDMYAHRVVYMIVTGVIEDGLHLDHLCRNPPCCNPDHLEPVTCRENILRSPVAIAAINAKKTHCKRGHALTGGNVVLASNGSRRCRTCSIQAGRERYSAVNGTPESTNPIDLSEPAAPRRSRDATACAKGHELDLSNTYIDRKGYVHCRACRAAATARYEKKKREKK